MLIAGDEALSRKRDKKLKKELKRQKKLQKLAMAGLKPALGPGVDTNAAATGVTKANLGQQLNPAEQQAVGALTPLVMKAATIPSAAPQLRSALTNAGTMARAAAAQQ